VKKLLALLLTMLVAFPLLAFADDAPTEAQVITFQGIPWGSSFEDTVAGLVSAGVIADSSSALLFEEDVYFYVLNESGEMHQVHQGESDFFQNNFAPQAMKYCYIGPYDVLPTFTMGGYKVNSLYFYFAFDGRNTKLLSVLVITLPSDNLPDMTLDLAQKLDSVYGPGRLTREVKNKLRSELTYTRRCEDNSAVYMYNLGDVAFDFMYGTTLAFDWLDEAYGHFTVENKTVDPADVGGL